MLAAFAVMTLTFAATHFTATPVEQAVPQEQPPQSPVAQVYDAVKGAIVRVRATADELEADEYLQRFVGSGVVIVNRGTILTNLHVVAGAGHIRVLFADGLESDASIVSQHPENDLAVLQAQTVPDDLAAATMRPRADLKPGDPVVAVGFPFGIGPSVSAGVVSGLKREYRSPGGESAALEPHPVRRRGQPGQLGRPAAQRRGRSGRYRHRDARPGRRRLRRHRLRGADRDRLGCRRHPAFLT